MDQKIDGIIGNDHGIMNAGDPYVMLIEVLSEEFGIPEVLISHQMGQESSFNPNVISIDGAIGIMQILPSTAAVIGPRHGLPFEPLTDPRINAALGVAYMRELVDVAFRFTDDPETAYRAALVGYFAGPRRIEQVAEGGDMTPTEKAYIGGTDINRRGVIWDFDKTESWSQLKRPGQVPGKRFPWWLLLIPVGIIYLKKR